MESLFSPERAFNKDRGKNIREVALLRRLFPNLSLTHFEKIRIRNFLVDFRALRNAKNLKVKR